ncbi:hypothetical protein AB0I94_35965 [Streptomyces sp. NPDC050147]|uniref:hypothetical protein n=1 Tax=Streptomyces sp. NPDC050147 TaxID=3155513 RepID=UPI003421AB5A
MPSYGEQPQPTYYPTPLPPQYGQPPAPVYGQQVVPLPQNTVVYPPTAGIDGVVMVPGPNGQHVAYYTPPPAPAPDPLVSPLLVKVALGTVIVAGAAVALYFIGQFILALAAFLKALAILAAVLLGGVVLIMLFSGSSGGGNINVQARGRSRVQIHTGRGHNRGRRR